MLEKVKLILMQSMIDKYRFNIDKIILTDNSIKKCGNKNMYKLKIEDNKYELFDTYFKWCCTK